MSITSSNNLAVNNSLTVNGNSIFGVDNTSSIICNSKPTFNSDVTISGNVTQSSGTFSTGSGNINLNGDVVISSNKKLTTGTGDTTINNLLKCNGNINNVGLLASSGSFELGPTTGTNFTYIDLKTTGGNGDYDARIGVTGGLLSTSGQGALSFNCASCAIAAPLTVNGITNNNTLTQSGTVTCNAINCTSINNSGSYNTINCSSIANSGTLTQNGTVTCNAINCSSIANSGTLTQTGTITCNAINCSSISNSGTLTQNGTVTCNAISCSSINSTSINNSGTLSQTGAASFNSLSATSINNSGVLSSSNIELSSSTSPAYIDMKTASGNSDLDVRLACNNGSSGTPGAGTLTITSGNTVINSPLTAYAATFEGITNNAPLQQNTNAAFTGFSSFAGMSNSGNFTNSGILHKIQHAICLNVSGLPKFDGASTQTLPSTNTGSNSGLAIYWNSDPSHNKGETCFLNMAQGGPGGYSFYSSSASEEPRELMYLNENSNLSSINNVSCNSLTTGNITAGSISTTAALNCGALTCSSITNNSNAYDSLYRNNIKCYTVKGYSFKNTPTNVNNVFSVYPGNTTSNSSSLSLIVDDTCWSISILYNYYTTYSSNTNLYQGSTKFMIMKYGNGSWITMTVSLSGSSNYRPASFSISEGVLTISHAQAAITDLTVYMFYKIEMY